MIILLIPITFSHVYVLINYCQEKLDVAHVQELKGLLFICSGGTGLLSCFYGATLYDEGVDLS